ncbi:MAG: sulfatase-like hydrolase/transferase, partial [Planctomycetes bacterium]|nr:sulfatase-like hydrolase/transferase [Planctomycetota bacterium]
TYPATHGVWNRVKIPGAGKAKAFPTLSEKADTLAEVLQREGYQTAAVADGGFLTDRRGLAQGFELFDSKTLWVKNRMDRALKWLKDERDESQPFFLFLHTYEVHYPYLPDAKYVNRFAGGYQGPIRDAVEEARDFLASNPVQNPIGDIQRKFFKPFFDNKDISQRDKDFIFALYDAEIAMTDDETARLFSYLQDSGLKGNTLVIITSDHGEEFWEHGRFGHNQIYEEVLSIPLLIQVPGGPKGIRRADPAELVDVMPSILSLLQIDTPAAAIGRDLDLANANAKPLARPTIAQANLPHIQTSWTNGSQKSFFEGPLRETSFLFDLNNDPQEQHDLSNEPTGAAIIMQSKKQLEMWLQACVTRRIELGLEPGINSIHQFTAEQARELEALGYVGGE